MKRTRNNYKKMAEPGYDIGMDGRKVIDSINFDDRALTDYGDDPIISFYTFVAQAFCMPLEEVNVCKIGLGRETMRKFNTALISYFRKRFSPYRIEYEYRMTHLCYAPLLIDELEEDKIHLLEVE